MSEGLGPRPGKRGGPDNFGDYSIEDERGLGVRVFGWWLKNEPKFSELQRLVGDFFFLFHSFALFCLGKVGIG